MAGGFKILLVCTGNICRSPMAEQMLRQKLGNQNHILTDSAGAFALEGKDMPDEAAASLLRRKYNLSKHSAKQLTADLADQADLILTAEQQHRSDVVRTSPSANRYTFTLKEFANLNRYLEDPLREEPFDKPKDLHDKVRITASTRGYAPVIKDLDLADPYFKPWQAYDETADSLENLLDEVVKWVANV